MSRCLPFPPPNYVKNGLGGEKLLQQLELRRKKAEYAKKKKKEEKGKEVKQKKRSHDDDNDDKKKKKRKEEKREKKRSHRVGDDNKNTQEGEKEHDVSPSSDSAEEEEEKKETSKEYKKLIENWFPLPLQMVPTDFENEEWLARKNDSNGETKTTDPTKHVSSNNITANIKQGIQPLAYYLPHADIYALPYVLPF